MGDTMLRILDIRQLYFGKSMVFGLFLACLLWLAARKQKPAVKALNWGSIIYVLLVMNPAALTVYLRWFDEKGIYWKVFWFLPILPVIGYVFTEAVSMGKRKIEKACILFAFSFLIILSGSLAFSYNAFEKRETKEKLEQDVMNILPLIESAEGEGYAAVTDTLLPYIRDYTGKITLLYSRNLEDNTTVCYGDVELRKQAEAVRDQMNSGPLDAAGLAGAAKEAGVVLIVLNAGTCDVQQMEAAGYQLIGYNTKYEVYHIVRSTPIRKDLSYGMHGGVYHIVRSTPIRKDLNYGMHGGVYKC